MADSLGRPPCISHSHWVACRAPGGWLFLRSHMRASHLYLNGALPSGHPYPFLRGCMSGTRWGDRS
jgi:hypothetical protein